MLEWIQQVRVHQRALQVAQCHSRTGFEFGGVGRLNRVEGERGGLVHHSIPRAYNVQRNGTVLTDRRWDSTEQILSYCQARARGYRENAEYALEGADHKLLAPVIALRFRDKMARAEGLKGEMAVYTADPWVGEWADDLLQESFREARACISKEHNLSHGGLHGLILRIGLP